MILKTLNAGETWIDISEGTNYYLNSIYFPTHDTGYAVGNRILKTVDAGENWEINLQITQYSFRSVYFTDSMKGYAVGENGVILNTTDGGENWNLQTSGTTATLNAVLFTDSLTGFIVGTNGTLLKTSDAGMTWTSKSPDGTWEWLRSISFVGKDVGYIAGENGEIFKTTDGGDVWIKENLETNVQFISVCFPELNTGFIFGDYGVAFKYSEFTGFQNNKFENSQDKYKLLPNPASESFHVLCPDFLDSARLIIFNSEGRFVKEISLDKKDIEISVHELPKGLYGLIIVNNMNCDFFKFIKN